MGVSTEQEIWPQRPRHFAAASHSHTAVSRGVCDTFHGGFDFGPYLVDGCGGEKQKVALLAKPLELFAPFSKAAK